MTNMTNQKKRKRILHFFILLSIVGTIVGVIVFPNQPDVSISLAASSVGEGSWLPITTNLISMWLVCGLLLIFAYFVRKNLAIIPGKAQLIVEMILEFFITKVEGTTNSRKDALILAPILTTLFLLIFLSNQSGFIPFTEAFPNIFGTPTSHFSFTIALAIFTIITGQLIAIKKSPFKAIFNYIKIDRLWKIRKFSDFPNALLEIFLGILDIIGEISKMISLAARLFGNMFSGGLLTLIIGSLAFFTAYFIPIPFLVLGAFSGLVQAVVFTFLAVEFMSGTVGAVPEKTQKS